ncbi:MAG: hypothetical protein MUC97_15010, partial [Bernardetiaceae bacterium]|nr:hypothetical protein [Bernardetiaceae bacterium]
MQPELQKLYSLLTSDNEPSILLALESLAKLSQLEKVFLTPLAFHGFLNPHLSNPKATQIAKLTFNKYASSSLKEVVAKRQNLAIISHPDIVDKLFFFKKTYYESRYHCAYTLHCLESYDEISEASWITKLDIEPGKYNIQCFSKILRKLPNVVDISVRGCKINEFTDDLPNNHTLTRLDLRGCGLLTLPRHLGNLKKLEWLLLSDNQISELPESLCSLENVTILDFDNNDLKQLPQNIGNLKMLNKLYLSGNNIATLPKSIGNLTNLEILCLADNSISGLPASLGALSNLTALNLDNNQLAKLPRNIVHLG